MLGRRELKKLAARLLPEALKAPLRGRLYGYRAAGVRLALELRPDGDGFVAVVDGDLVLRIPAQALPDVGYHFRDNGESMEEMAGLVRVAREADGRLLWDVGAHRGLFSAVFCAAAPGNRAVGFEPSPVLAADSRDLLARNGLQPRAEIRQAAVGAASGQMRAMVDEAGLIMLDRDDGDPVEIVTLDAECQARGEQPDVVKIDVEGYEDEVLRGATHLLSTRRPVLLLELHLDLLEKKGADAAALVRSLTGLGYRFSTPLGRPLSPAAVYDSPTAILRCVAR